MLPEKKIAGVIPAVLLPRDASGRALWEEFDQLLAFLSTTDITGVCVNGATGEYVLASPEERREAVKRARRVVGGSRLVLSGVGGTSLGEVLRNVDAAEAEGADGVLTPAPHFFRYGQVDLAAFFVAVAGAVKVPMLLYNLAAFAGAIDKDTSVSLIGGNAQIVGIKDSSGSLATLEALSAPGAPAAVRMMGNDAVLAEAMRRQYCDGVITGVGCVVPELLVGLWGATGAHFERLAKQLSLLIPELDRWPVPWGLKLMAERRGLAKAAFAIPMAEARLQERAAFEAWFDSWWAETREMLTAASNAAA